MPKGCVWLVNCQRPCGAPAQHGRLCTDHLKRVQELVGTRDCGWPGCTRPAWDRAGACSLHRQGLLELDGGLSANRSLGRLGFGRVGDGATLPEPFVVCISVDAEPQGVLV